MQNTIPLHQHDYTFQINMNFTSSLILISFNPFQDPPSPLLSQHKHYDNICIPLVLDATSRKLTATINQQQRSTQPVVPSSLQISIHLSSMLALHLGVSCYFDHACNNNNKTLSQTIVDMIACGIPLQRFQLHRL